MDNNTILDNAKQNRASGHENTESSDYQTRTSRFAAFDRSSSFRPFTNGDFELGKNVWNSIWPDKNRYPSEETDEEPIRPSPIRHPSQTSYHSNAGMTNLRNPGDQSNGSAGNPAAFPWKSTNANGTFAPQYVPQISPSRSTMEGTFANTNGRRRSGEDADLLTGSTPFEDDQFRRAFLSQRITNEAAPYRYSTERSDPRTTDTVAGHKIQNLNAAQFTRNNAIMVSVDSKDSTTPSTGASKATGTVSYSGGPVMHRPESTFPPFTSYAVLQSRYPSKPTPPVSRQPSNTVRPNGFANAIGSSFDGVDETAAGMGGLTLHSGYAMSESIRERYDTHSQLLSDSLQLQSPGYGTGLGPTSTNGSSYTQGSRNEHTSTVPPSNVSLRTNAHTRGDRGTYTPQSSNLRSIHSPYYSSVNTPPTGPGSRRSPSVAGVSGRSTQYDAVLLDRKLRDLDINTYEFSLMNNVVPYATTYDYPLSAPNVRMNPLAHSYTMTGNSSVGGTALGLRLPAREVDQVQILRSAILEDFRVNSKTNKRYELKDIYEHVVEFSGDQHGSRFIQSKLETANSDEKEQVFKEILPNSLQLMTDVFGNYVIQKMFEHGNQTQKKLLADKMKGQVLNLSTQMYGCRVVQKALEHVLTDQQASMVKELDGPNERVIKVIKDQNGNHVVQKAIERVPAEYIQFIVDAHQGQVVALAKHTYGCRVIQRILEHCEPPARCVILRELHNGVLPLISDAFGNYVIQHVIEKGEPSDRRRVVTIVQNQLLFFSKHKFASNVVEKCLEYADEDQRQDMLRQLTRPDEQGETPVLGLLRDQYGNYVIQKVHGLLQGAELEALVAEMKNHFPTLRRTSYGKQAIAIEKLLFEAPPSLSTSRSSTVPSTTASSSDAAVTPPGVRFVERPAMHETPIVLPMGVLPPNY